MTADFDQRTLRNAMGCYPTGVTVVTTQSMQGPLGMTANSFASVSLDPPLVLWSPARKSERFKAFEAAEHFVVHVLASDQQDISNAFATAGLEPFAQIAHRPGLGGAPVIDHCAAVFQCRHAAGYDGGDHLIVVGEVLSIEQTEKSPLLYHKGAYAALAHNPET